MANTFITSLGGDREKSFASPLALLFLLIVTSVYFVFGQMVAPAWMLILPVAAIVLVGYSLNKDSVLVSILVLTLTLVQLKIDKGVFTIYDALAGIVLVGSMMLIFFRTVIAPNRYLVRNVQYSLFMVYMGWVSLVGMTNFFSGESTVEGWFRDMLLLSPLIILPPLVIGIRTLKARRIFFTVMILTWVICVVIAVLRIRSSFLESTYLFEVSYRMINGLNGPLMLLVFFNLYLFENRERRRYLLLVGILISIGAIILTHNRTFWVLTPVGVLVSLLLATSGQRKKAYVLFIQMLLVMGVIFVIGYFTIPLFRIFADLFFSYFLTSSHLKTDPSLVGRYIEWRHIWQAILDSPITGHGMGSKYHTYNWFQGFFYDSSYTHNGYLGVLHKGGVVGFIILFASYLGFIKRGWKLIRNKTLDSTTQALIRSGTIILVLLLIATNTANIFAHRDLMMYVGIIWGYILLAERMRPSDPVESPVKELG